MPTSNFTSILGGNYLYTNHISTKQAVMRGPTRVKRKESEKHPFRGTPKKPEKGQEWIYPGQPLTFMFKSIEI